MGCGSREAVAAAVRAPRRGPGPGWLAVMLWAACARRPDGEPQTPAPQPAPQETATFVAAIPRDTTSDKLLVTETEYQGWRYFQVFCARCHGEDALGALNAPNLTFSVSPDGGITRDSFMVIARGGLANKAMQGFQALLDDPQIATIYAYVKARSEGRLGRGRPHRAPTNR